MEWKDTDLAYLAGIIDGEGTVEARIDSRHETWLSIRIHIANSNHQVMVWMKDLFGGCLYDRKIYKPHHLPQKGWAVNGLKAINIAKIVLPYAIIKKEQLRLIIELETLRGKYEVGTQGPRVTQEMVEKRLPIVNKIVEMNRRGSSQWVNRPNWRRLPEISKELL